MPQASIILRLPCVARYRHFLQPLHTAMYSYGERFTKYLYRSTIRTSGYDSHCSETLAARGIPARGAARDI